MLPCICRRTSDRRGSASPRISPGGVCSSDIERRVSISYTSTRRVRINAHPGPCLVDSSRTNRTSIDRRSTPRTCNRSGSIAANRAASGDSKTKWPPSKRTSGGPSGLPCRISSICVTACGGSMCTGSTESKPDNVNPGVFGNSRKSPASKVRNCCPSTARRQQPSRTAQS